MNVGHLMVLFGLNVQSASFRHGLHLLAAVHMGATAALEGVAGLAHGIINLTEELSEEATHLHSMSQAMGVSIEYAQKLGYVAEQSGSNIKELAVGMSMLQGNLRKLANDQAAPRLAQMFREMGISKADAILARDHIDGVTGAITKMSATLHRTGVAGESTAVMRGLVGARAARALTADLIRGPEAIEKMFKRLEDIGGVVSNKSIIALQNIYDVTIDIKKAWHGVTGEIIGQLAPIITDVLNQMALWIGQNRVLINEVLTALVEHLIYGFNILIKLVTLVASFIKGVIHGDAGAVALFSIFAAGIIMIAALIVTALLPTISLIGGALFAAMLLLLPYTILLAAIIALSILIYKHWAAFGEFFSLVGKNIASDARAVWQGFVDLVYRVVAKIKEKLGSIGDWWSNLLDDAWDVLKTVCQAIVGTVVDMVNKITGLLNLIPGVEIGTLDMPDWVKNAAAKAGTGAPGNKSANVGPQTGEEYTANARVATVGRATGEGASARNVNVAPTTVNIYGVKDAKEASGHIATAIDAQNRHAAAALGGEI